MPCGVQSVMGSSRGAFVVLGNDTCHLGKTCGIRPQQRLRGLQLHFRFQKTDAAPASTRCNCHLCAESEDLEASLTPSQSNLLNSFTITCNAAVSLATDSGHPYWGSSLGPEEKSHVQKVNHHLAPDLKAKCFCFADVTAARDTISVCSMFHDRPKQSTCWL